MLLTTRGLICRTGRISLNVSLTIWGLDLGGSTGHSRYTTRSCTTGISTFRVRTVTEGGRSSRSPAAPSRIRAPRRAFNRQWKRDRPKQQPAPDGRTGHHPIWRAPPAPVKAEAAAFACCRRSTRRHSADYGFVPFVPSDFGFDGTQGTVEDAPALDEAATSHRTSNPTNAATSSRDNSSN